MILQSYLYLFQNLKSADRREVIEYLWHDLGCGCQVCRPIDGIVAWLT